MTLTDNIKTTLNGCAIDTAQPSETTLAVALSGGADSVCLLLALKEMGYALHAMHCNFELRGAESDADEAFCRRLCRQNDIPLAVKHFRTQTYARRHGISIEMAARELRYTWFAEQMAELGATALCVAHHRDDQAETILLNLIRGTGIRGLCGMAQRNARAVVRPLLNVSRSEIEEWLGERGQTWVTDSTNLSPEAAQRNAIRLKVVPALQEINPAAQANIALSGQRMSEALRLYNFAIAEQRRHVEHDNDIDIEALRTSIAPQTLLYEILREHDFTPEQVADIYQHLDGEPGHEWQSATCRLLRNRGRLQWQTKEHSGTDSHASTRSANVRGSADECVMPLEGLFEAPKGERLLIRRQAINPATFSIPRAQGTACFDLEKLTLPLTIRTVRQGDRIRPFGMEGTRLVSDLLTDLKLSLFEKERQAVVVSGEEIVWVVGIRAAAGFEIDGSTRHAMTLTLL